MYTRISEGFGTMKNTYKHSSRVLLERLQYPTFHIFMCSVQENTYRVCMYHHAYYYIYTLCVTFLTIIQRIKRGALPKKKQIANAIVDVLLQTSACPI